MPNRSADILFQLIHSLEKSEKRNFKLYIQRNSGNQHLKIVQLFDAIDKLTTYDETALKQKLPKITNPQFANLKSHLYKQILASLRLLKSNDTIDMQLHEQLDYARILYNKGLYYQSLKILDRLKEAAQQNFQESMLIQAISLEKKIETLHITRSMQDRAERLTAEAVAVAEKRTNITKLSNLALLLYSWYIRYGHARNIEDEKGVKVFFEKSISQISMDHHDFYEKLYLYQSYSWFAFIRQDFLMYYRYTQKWVDLFEEEVKMKEIETAHYLKGMHNLLNALYDLKHYQRNYEVLKKFEKFSTTLLATQDINVRVQTFIYVQGAKLNRYISTGSFKKGIALIPLLEEKLKEYYLLLDSHRILVFNYKFATIYFGAGDYDTCIDYLRLIINDQPGLRTDLQCYARLLHLIAHYEAGNTEIMDSLIKSVYRFMAKMQNLTVVEEVMFKFLRQSFSRSPKNISKDFQKLYDQIKHLENSRFETRAYAYLDIFSWVESKVQQKTMGEIIKAKYLASKRK